MLTIAPVWVYISLVTFLAGWFTIGTYTGSGHNQDRAIPLSLFPLIGLAEISALTGFLSLFMPIGWAANAIVLTIVVGLVWIRRKELPVLSALIRKAWTGSKLLVAALALLFLVLVMKSAMTADFPGDVTRTFHSDTAYYHAQSIRWIEEFRVVPGLGNLLPSLSIDYLWFQPAALFGFSWLLPQRLHALTGFAEFWAICFALGGVREISLGRDRWVASNLFRVLMLFPLLELGNYLKSDSGDEPAALYILLTLAMGFRYFEMKPEKPAPDSVVMAVLILAFFSIGIKLSALPLGLLIATLTFRTWRESGWQSVGVAAGIGLLVLAPKLARSVVLSGYLVYPFPAINVFDVDWKVPREVVDIERRYIESIARSFPEKPGEMLQGGLGVWLQDWLTHFFRTPLALCLASSLVAFGAALCFRPRSTLSWFGQVISVYLTVLVGVGFWFLTAPQLRYGYGWLAASPIVLLLPLMRFTPAGYADASVGQWRIRAAPLAGFALAILLLFTYPKPFPGYALGSGVALSDRNWNRMDRMRRGKAPRRAWFFQDPYPVATTLQLSLGTLLMQRPATGQFCWETAVPCTPYLYRRIEARGPSLQDGFRAISGSVESFDGGRIAREWEERRAASRRQ